MRKARADVRACKDCGVVESPWTKLSQKGLCSPCGNKRMMDALEQLRNRKGPVYDKWFEGIHSFRDGKENN